MKRLIDGERRTMRPGLQAAKNIVVIAERVDSETPYVILKLTDHLFCPAVCLTNVGAEELCARINRALNILPTSK